jgi:hypothetical protein
MDNVHPLIALYGETLQKNFPLIMFVGREPNDDARCMAEVGSYDFDVAPRCAFWNMAYKILADFGAPGKMALSDLKDMCRQRKSSPVAFTDISPKPIPHKVLNKAEIRSAIPWPEKQAHLENISKDFLKRVSLFFLTGLEGNEFIESKNYFAE